MRMTWFRKDLSPRKKRQEKWLKVFRIYRGVFHYPVGRARHYARMYVDKKIKAEKDGTKFAAALGGKLA